MQAPVSELPPILGITCVFETDLKPHPYSDTYLQLCHPYSNKATPNNATPYRLNIQTHESMEAISIQTTTFHCMAP